MATKGGYSLDCKTPTHTTTIDKTDIYSRKHTSPDLSVHAVMLHVTTSIVYALAFLGVLGLVVLRQGNALACVAMHGGWGFSLCTAQAFGNKERVTRNEADRLQTGH